MDISNKITQSFESQAFMGTIGAKLDLVEEGKVIISVELKPSMMQQHGFGQRIRRFRVRRAPPRLFRRARRRARRLRRLRRRVCRFHRRRYRAVLVSHSFVVFIMTIRVARVLRVASSAQPTPTVFSNDVASARHTSSRVRYRAPRPRTRREHGLVGTIQGRPRPRLDRAGRLLRRERIVSVHPQDRPGEPIWRSARARRGVRATSDAGSDQER